MGRLPSSGGIEPVRLLFWRSRRVTQPLLAVVTPNQVENGFWLSQLLLSCQSGPPVAL